MSLSTPLEIIASVYFHTILTILYVKKSKVSGSDPLDGDIYLADRITGQILHRLLDAVLHLLRHLFDAVAVVQQHKDTDLYAVAQRSDLHQLMGGFGQQPPTEGFGRLHHLGHPLNIADYQLSDLSDHLFGNVQGEIVPFFTKIHTGLPPFGDTAWRFLSNGNRTST